MVPVSGLPGIPSPQSTVTVWLSSTPGSVNVPLSVTVPPSSIVPAFVVSDVTAGATLFTCSVSDPTPVSPNALVTSASTT